MDTADGELAGMRDGYLNGVTKGFYLETSLLTSGSDAARLGWALLLGPSAAF